MIAPAISYHITRACNTKCKFCFATFRDVKGRSPKEDTLRIIRELAKAGVEKITFAGGEPTLHPNLGLFLQETKKAGMVTSIISNGFRLPKILDDHGDIIDWVGLSVDSANEATQYGLGRGNGSHAQESLELAQRCHDMGIKVKLNTVVTIANWEEDMSAYVRQFNPHRWKVFQVLPILGQNDGKVEPLEITAEQFQHFLDRHSDLSPVAENNDAMLGSYLLIDPVGRFFGDSTGTHVYSHPILDVGVEQAASEVGFEWDKFYSRGGKYDW